MAKEVVWQSTGQVENGHAWERALTEFGVRVGTRCAHCGETPLNVTGPDNKVLPCRAVYGASGKPIPRPNSIPEPL